MYNAAELNDLMLQTTARNSVNINGHSLAAAYLPRCVLFSSHMRQNAFHPYLKWTFGDLLPCYCYAIKTYS